MINMHIIWVLLMLIVISVIQVSGLTSFGTSVSRSSTYSTDPGQSLTISSSTRTITDDSGTASPVATPASLQNTGREKPPSRWKAGTREGMFFDPVSQTSWVFDRVLNRYYSPDNGWFLVEMYYYDPHSTTFIDMDTGKVVTPGTTETQPSAQETPRITPTPSLVQPEAGNKPPSDPCIVPCSDCDGGKCKDCNHNGICDDVENTLSQTTAKPTMIPSLNQTPTALPTTPKGQSGLSEKPQGSILYQVMLPMINCTVGQNCTQCIDLNRNGICDPDEPREFTCENTGHCNTEPCWSKNDSRICDPETVNWSIQMIQSGKK